MDTRPGDSIDIKFRVRVEFELMVELTTITKKYTKSGVADPLPEEQVLRAGVSSEEVGQG